MNKKESKKYKKRVILLDTHAILHRAYHALPGFTAQSGKPTGALYGLSTMLIKTINELSPDYIIATYDLPEPTYRHDVYKDYKAGRAKTDDDLIFQLQESKKIMDAFGIPRYEKAGFEADDILATIVEELKGRKDVEVIITSGDMDTLQLVDGNKVKVYTLRKGIKDTVMYNEDAVKERFGFDPERLTDFKGLCGDQSDNIPGVSGIGEKTAKDLINKFGTIENLYDKLKKDEEELKKEGIKPRVINLLKEQEEEAVFSKMLATVRRDVDIEFLLPDKSTIEKIDIEKVKNIFSEFDFRSLYGRLEESLGEKSSEMEDSNEETEKLSDKELKETFIALWLLNSNITDPSEEDVLRFANSKNPKEAREYILKEIKNKNLSFVFEKIELSIIKPIERMQNRGIMVDKNYLSKISKEYHKELSKIEQKIWSYAGEEFNINSPKQMGEVLFDKMGLKLKNHKKTGGGSLSTRESELEKMQGMHPIIEEILEYREIQKLLSTYIDNIPEMLDEKSRLHAEFIQTGTTTGRMSSKNPNLQNIPIRSERGRKIRNAFVASEGFALVSADYSQIELRVAAFLSGDEKLINIFKEGGDPHSAVASLVFDVPYKEVDSEMRRKAKVINFGILYGMGINALKQNLGSSMEEARQYLNDYFEKFNGLANYIEKVKEDAKNKGYTETYFGRRRYIEGINSHIPYIKSGAERMAINAPIQGTSADMIKIAMSQAYNFIKENKLKDDMFLLLQVHDELVYEIKNEKLEEIKEKIKNIMESVISKEESSGMIFEVDLNTARSWGELK